MAAKKKSSSKSKSKSKKSVAKKSAPKKKAAAKKKAAPKKAAAKKKATPKKAAAKKKTSAEKKSAGPAKKSATGNKATAKKSSTPESAPADTKPATQAARPAGSVSSMDVSFGHVFRVKPRIDTSFKRDDFQQAKRALKDEVYEDLRAAVRAVAEEALALTRGAASKPQFSKRR